MEWIDLEFFTSKKFKGITRFLREEAEQGKTIYPPRENILRALALTPFDETKVVILGQDPYHTPNFATGLAFAVPNDSPKIPPSLINILKEWKDDVGETNGTAPTLDLTSWAQQGVLLLNTSLTVEQGQADSHKHIGWGLLVRDVLMALAEKKEHIVYILWGRNAQIFEMYINLNDNLVIKSAHPSPFSANKGFFGSKPFSRTNTYLEEHGIIPINW